MNTAPLSLHFGLKKGEHADLETVARAAVEWVEVIRDLAAIVTPDFEYQIEFVESDEGSVWLSNLIKAVRTGDRKALATLTFAAVIFFAMGPFLHLQNDMGDAIWKAFGHVDTADLSEADKQDIADKVVAALKKTELHERKRRMVSYVEKDPHVTSIGVGYAPTERGAIAEIPRDQFPIYTAPVVPPAQIVVKETKFRWRVVVKITRANLKEGDAKPRWRFFDGESEWSADIEDDEFVAALNHETTGLPLAVGQQMTVNVSIDGRVIDGVWHIDNRRITRVLIPEVNRRQQELLGDE